jgi:hypothetical protein
MVEVVHPAFLKVTPPDMDLLPSSIDFIFENLEFSSVLTNSRLVKIPKDRVSIEALSKKLSK